MKQEKDIEQLFRRHYGKMYNLARYIFSDDEESKDDYIDKPLVWNASLYQNEEIAFFRFMNFGLYDKKRPGVGAKIPYMTKRDPKVGSTPLSIGRVSLDKVLNKHLSPLFAETPMQVEFCLQVGIQ